MPVPGSFERPETPSSVYCPAWSWWKRAQRLENGSTASARSSCQLRHCWLEWVQQLLERVWRRFKGVHNALCYRVHVSTAWLSYNLVGFKDSTCVCLLVVKAPDVEFVTEVINRICSHKNIAPYVAIMGTSNGCGLLYNVLINNPDPRIRWGIGEVTQLHSYQYHDGKFWKQGPHNEFVTCLGVVCLHSTTTLFV